MLGAYGWAFVKPVRKLYYNLNITLISVLVALVVGTIEVFTIIAMEFHLSGGIWDYLGSLDFGVLFLPAASGFLSTSPKRTLSTSSVTKRAEEELKCS